MCVCVCVCVCACLCVCVIQISCHFSCVGRWGRGRRSLKDEEGSGLNSFFRGYNIDQEYRRKRICPLTQTYYKTKITLLKYIFLLKLIVFTRSSLKKSFIPGDFEGANPSNLRKHDSQKIILAIASCQRVVGEGGGSGVDKAQFIELDLLTRLPLETQGKGPKTPAFCPSPSP